MHIVLQKEAYKKALKMDPTQVDCLYDLAMSLFNEKKIEESKRYLLEFLANQSSYEIGRAHV